MFKLYLILMFSGTYLLNNYKNRFSKENAKECSSYNKKSPGDQNHFNHSKTFYSSTNNNRSVIKHIFQIEYWLIFGRLKYEKL